MSRQKVAVCATAFMLTAGLLIAGCQAYFMPTRKVGETAPSITFSKLMQAPNYREATSWADLRGQVVVMTFFEPWNNASIAAFPHLNEVARQCDGLPVQFIAVTSEDSEQTLVDFTAKMPIPGWIGMDADRSMFRQYGVWDLPHVYVMDQRGKVVAITYPHLLTKGLIQAVLEGKTIVPIKEGFHNF